MNFGIDFRVICRLLCFHSTSVKTLPHQTVHTRHFQRAMEEATGRNLDRFFEQWVHSPGHPQLDVNLSAGGGLLTVGVSQKQSGDDVPEAFALKLRLEVVYDDDTTRVIDLPIAERERAWAVPLDGEVKTVRVDPGFRVLAEIKVKAPEPWLVALLDDGCPVVASSAAQSLLATDSANAVSAVHEALRRQQHVPDVQLARHYLAWRQVLLLDPGVQSAVR